MPINIKTKKYLGVTFIIILGLLITLRLAYLVHLELGYKQTQAQSKAQIKELIRFMKGSLSRYESIPHVLSTNPLLANALRRQHDAKSIRSLNKYLEEIQSVTKAMDIYLVNTEGLAIAASNWQQDYTFIGKNYGFRPYFQQALKGQRGRYYAVGTSSNKRGYYFSYPIYEHGYPIKPANHNDKVLGVIVVKVDITKIERHGTGMAQASAYEFAITDKNNIIFLSSVPNWRLTSLTPLDNEKKNLLTSSRRYANRTISMLTIKPPYKETLDKTYKIYQIKNRKKRLQSYMETKAPMSNVGWNVHIFAPMIPIYRSLPPLLLLYGTLYLLVTLTLLYTIERRKNNLRMKQVNDQLEQRVKARTIALETSNQQLKETQDELIQAAKLTVIGSLSASINHEINQPLAAIRSYAQNTQTLLIRAKLDQVSSNLTTIIDLTDRLAAIVAQFKSFTRKNSGNDKATCVNQCIHDALTIIQPEVDKQGIELILNNQDSKAFVWCDSILLQQVLINLMSNAIVAMRHTATKQLIISVIKSDQLHIMIEDSGTGIEESKMEKIFAPYYTSSRQGLGLGLSISRRIIEAMQGQITVANRAQSGAVFNITLPIHIPRG